MKKLQNKKTVDQLPMVNTAMFVFAISGNWRPLWWPARWKFIYDFYSVLTNFILFTHVLSELINLIVDINTLAGLTNKCLSLIPVTNSCCKGINILLNRRKIIDVLNMLNGDHCKIRDLREMRLQRKYERFCRWVSGVCLIFDLATVVSLLVIPFMRNTDTKELPFMAWFPFVVDTELAFWAVFIYESIASLIATGYFAANDLLVISIVLEICRQLDMLSGRLSELAATNFVKAGKREKEIKEKLVDCVDHHNFIFKLAEATQGCFVVTFATQMATSLIGTCTSAYHLSRYDIGSPYFNKAVFVFLVMIFEAFLYCWFGNTVRLKSLEIGNAVYKMHWFNLTTGLQKDLVNIFMRSHRPIIFKSAPTVSLSIDAFVAILRASYTVFTVLKRIGIKSQNEMIVQDYEKTL